MPFDRLLGGRRDKSGWPSCLLTGHIFADCCGLLRCCKLLLDHWLKSDVDESEPPLAREPLVATEVPDESEEMEDDEDERARFFRGANMLRTSSPLTVLFPLIVPFHAERDSCGKAGAFATAVIRKS